MMGWIAFAVLWVLGAPFVWDSVRSKNGSDKNLQWLFWLIWPFLVLAAWISGIWFRIVYRGK